jgi:uncharacterized protein with HEPN domain
MPRDSKLYLEDHRQAIEKIEIIWDILKNKLPGLRDAVTRIQDEGV